MRDPVGEPSARKPGRASFVRTFFMETVFHKDLVAASSLAIDAAIFNAGHFDLEPFLEEKKTVVLMRTIE